MLEAKENLIKTRTLQIQKIVRTLDPKETLKISSVTTSQIQDIATLKKGQGEDVNLSMILQTEYLCVHLVSTVRGPDVNYHTPG